MPTDYVYTPLKGNHGIRLFSFYSSRERFRLFARARRPSHSSIEGNLHRVCLDDSRRQSYVALSYTWGSPFPPGLLPRPCASNSPRQMIKCDGKQLPVEDNLHDALLVLRDLKPSFPIWIDALCINQQSDNERNAQVSMMGDIYSRAAAVYVWLGPHDSSSRIAVGVMERLRRAFSSIPPEEIPRGSFKFNDPVLYKSIGIDQITIVEWQAVVNLFSRTWFHRAWIAQEVALSADLLFLCGDSKISKDTLTGFAKWICELGWDRHLDQLRKDKKTQPIGGIDALFHIGQLRYRMSCGLKDPN